MKKTIVFYREWGELISNLPTEIAGDLIKTICAYCFGGDFESPDPVVKAMFAMIRRKLDADAASYAEVCKKRAEAGRLGGTKKQMLANANKRVANESKAKQTGGDNDNDNDNDNDLNPLPLLATPGAYFPNDPELDKAFSDFIEYRRSNGKPVQFERLKQKLWKEGKGDRDTMIKLLDESMAQGWTGIYAKKDEKKKSKFSFDGERGTDYAALEEELLNNQRRIKA